jgi:hypothetical protein
MMKPGFKPHFNAKQNVGRMVEPPSTRLPAQILAQMGQAQVSGQSRIFYRH